MDLRGTSPAEMGRLRSAIAAEVNSVHHTVYKNISPPRPQLERSIELLGLLSSDPRVSPHGPSGQRG